MQRSGTRRSVTYRLFDIKAAAIVGIVVAALLLVLTAGTAITVHAQAIQTSNPTVTSADPNAITFGLRVNTPSGLKSARLEYSVRNPDGDVGGGGEATIAPGPEVDLSFTLNTRDNQRYIPVGSIFRYHWQLTANDGSTMQTPDEEYLFLDGRYDWQTRADDDGQVTVYFYGNNEAAALAALNAVSSALDDTGALLDAQVEYPVRLVVYRTEEDGKLAMRPQSPTFDAQVRTGGQRVAPDLIFAFDGAPDIIRHETAHIVTHVAGDGPFVGLPSWLDEGTAVYMQASPGGYEAAVRLAIQGNRTLSLRSMQTPTSRPGEVDIFYGQSWSTVKFLIDQYGQPKFAELYRTIHEGARIDDALQTVYGFNQDGLYNAWREANGLQPVEVAGPTGSNGAPAAQGTRPPLGVPTSSGGASDQPAATPAGGEVPVEESGSDDGSNTMVAIIVLAGTVLVAGALGGGGFYLMRQRASKR